MAEKKLIEMVCTGNNGRSPVAELIARNTLEDIGASADYEAVSSGTAVDDSDNFLERKVTDNYEMVNDIIDIARNNNLYSKEQLGEIDKALVDQNHEALLGYAIDTAIQLMANEQDHRNRAVSKLGIRGDIKPGKDQTIARPDTVVVLSMDNGNYEKINGIYAPVSYSPHIDTLTRFATGEDGEVANAFGKSIDVYTEMVEQLMEEVPQAVNRVLN